MFGPKRFFHGIPRQALLHTLFLCMFAPGAFAALGENYIQTEAVCPVCGHAFSGPAFSEMFIVASHRDFRSATEERLTSLLDGFYYMQPLRSCPDCGLTLPDGFYREMTLVPDGEAFVAKITAYLRSDEFKNADKNGPPHFRFARVVERMDPKALEDNPLHMFFLAFWYAAGSWQAEGHSYPDLEYAANPEYAVSCLEESADRFDSGFAQLREASPTQLAFTELILQACYMNADVNRKLGRMDKAKNALDAYRRQSETASSSYRDGPIVPEADLRLSGLDRMAERLERLVAAGDSTSRIYLKDYLETPEEQPEE